MILGRLTSPKMRRNSRMRVRLTRQHAALCPSIEAIEPRLFFNITPGFGADHLYRPMSDASRAGTFDRSLAYTNYEIYNPSAEVGLQPHGISAPAAGTRTPAQ